MAEGDDAEDKTQAPTARRLERARDDGQVALSREVPVLAGLTVGLGVLMMAGPGLSRTLALRLQDLMGAAADWDVVRDGGVAPLRAAVLTWVMTTAPLTLSVVAASLAAVILQTGVLFRPAALLPDFSRIDPRSGLKRLLGLDHLIEAIKSIAKIIVMAFAGRHVLAQELAALPEAPGWDMAKLLGRMMRDLETLMLSMLAAQAAIAVLDVTWVRIRHSGKLRMTREDVRQETRETEGSPETKQRFRRIRLVRARRRMMAAVPKAAVVVTNPTHYAVALAYDRGQNAAPKVVAKGVDEMAMRIRDLAREHGIPLVANPPLARALFLVELDLEIPAEHFQAVAGIIAYVWRLRGRMAARSGTTERAPVQ